MIAPVTWNIKVTASTYWWTLLTIKRNGAVADITGNGYAAQVTTKRPTVAVATFACSIIDGPTGQLLVELLPAESAKLTPGGGYVWALEETAAGKPVEVVDGIVTVTAKIVQP